MSAPVTLRTDAGDEHLDLAEFEARLRRGEISPQCLVRLAAVTHDAFVPACDLELYKRLHEPRRAYFTRAFKVSRFPWLTSALILANLGLYFWTVDSGQMALDDMVRYGGKVRPLVADLGQFWRLFTANFLHRDPVHIGLNMFVLFNVGGVLENTYRTLDYLWLLVFTGVATMTASLLLSDAVTIGASGMVFGCLGGIVAFGLRYRSDLPGRYRSVMGDAAIPTVLGLLLIGITSRGVDNWAHVGGLVAGITTGAFMRPRLLTDPLRFWWEPALRAAPSFAVLLVVLLGHVFFGSLLPTTRVERDDAFGFQVRVPSSWMRGANPLGAVAWYNGLSGVGRASFAAEAVEMVGDPDPHARARAFIEKTLTPEALGAGVTSVKVEAPTSLRLVEGDGVRVRAQLSGEGGPTRLSAAFIPRGDFVFQLVFTWPEEYPGYEQVGEDLLGSVRFDEPRRLRLARAEALLFPNAPLTLSRLGVALLEQGHPLAAADALSATLRADPSNLVARVELSRAWLEAGDVELACQASKAAVAYGPDVPEVLEADARCELARGDVPRALERVRQARLVAPGDKRLEAVELKLRATPNVVE